MAFCTNCGYQMADQARFCPGCGSPAGAGVAPAGAVTRTVAVAEPLDFSVEGDNLQVVRIRLKPGQEVYAEAGKMVYKTPNVSWETRMTGESIGQKIWGALKRTFTGESLFLTFFRASSPGEVGFAGDYPGRIQVFELAPGQSILAQRDSFIVA